MIQNVEHFGWWARTRYRCRESLGSGLGPWMPSPGPPSCCGWSHGLQGLLQKLLMLKATEDLKAQQQLLQQQRQQVLNERIPPVPDNLDTMNEGDQGKRGADQNIDPSWSSLELVNWSEHRLDQQFVTWISWVFLISVWPLTGPCLIGSRRVEIGNFVRLN